MPQEEIVKKEQTHDVSIALIQKDMEYVRKSLDKIDNTLLAMDRNYTRRDEFTSTLKVIEGLEKALKDGLAMKVDRDDFDPIKKTLSRINWMLIAAVVGRLLTLIVKSGS